MQLPLVGKLVGMFVDRILGETFPDETGAARLQQVGLFTLIFVLEQQGETATVPRLVELTGQSSSAIYIQLEKLLKVDVIERKRMPNKRGRSYVYHLSIRHNEKTKRLIEAIAKSSATRSGAGRK